MSAFGCPGWEHPGWRGPTTTGIQTACFGQNPAVSATLPQVLSAPWLTLQVPSDDADSSCAPG